MEMRARQQSRRYAGRTPRSFCSRSEHSIHSGGDFPGYLVFFLRGLDHQESLLFAGRDFQESLLNFLSETQELLFEPIVEKAGGKTIIGFSIGGSEFFDIQ